MNPQDRCTSCWKARLLLGVVFLLVALCTPQIGDDAKSVEKDGAKKNALGKDMTPAEVHFRDGSKLKLTLREERIELVTAYGKLLIPTSEIRQIDVGFHIDAASSKRVEAAIGRLGSTDFKEREKATSELLALAEKAFPALVEAAKSNDMEVVARAEDVMAKLREKVAQENLDRPAHDVVLTADSRITGHIAAESFKVKTAQFGDQLVQLGDLRSLHLAGAEADIVALPDPGSLMNLQEKIGKSFVFKVTGNVNGGIWGVGVYTPDSPLATVAVHAGILKNGQTGLVKVTIVPGQNIYVGGQQNGVNSQPWNGGFTGAYQVSKP